MATASWGQGCLAAQNQCPVKEVIRESRKALVRVLQEAGDFLMLTAPSPGPLGTVLSSHPPSLLSAAMQESQSDSGKLSKSLVSTRRLVGHGFCGLCPLPPRTPSSWGASRRE